MEYASLEVLSKFLLQAGGEKERERDGNDGMRTMSHYKNLNPLAHLQPPFTHLISNTEGCLAS